VTQLEEFGWRVSQERRLKAARDRRDIGQKEIAKAVGTTSASVSRWEAGLNMPNDKQLEKLAAYFGVTAAWLRYGVETKSGAERMTQRKQSPPVVVVPRRRGRGRGGSDG
jgi:transcriptional regulator with XRE-family HTH domain